MAVSTDEILEAIGNMTVLEVVDLIKAMEDKFGVTAAAAVVAAAVVAGAFAAVVSAAPPQAISVNPIIPESTSANSFFIIFSPLSYFSVSAACSLP